VRFTTKPRKYKLEDFQRKKSMVGSSDGRLTFMREPSRALAESVDYVPPAPLGIPMLARLRDDSRKRTIESYTSLQQTINEYLETLTVQVERKTTLMDAQLRAITRSDSIHEIAQLEVAGEIDELRHRASARAKERELELARLDRELAQERKAIDAINNPPDVRQPPSAADHMSALMADVQEMDTAFTAHIADIIKEHGGSEDTLSEGARRHIDTVRMLQATKVAALYERLA
jgi:hypothetical protein